jgi:hypothetical protein
MLNSIPSEDGDAASRGKLQKSFILYNDMIDSVDELTDEEAGRLLKAILYFQNDLDCSWFDRVTLLLLKPLETQFKRDAAKWEDKKSKRVEAGRKGGLAKASNAKHCQAMPSDGKQRLANLAVSVNGSVSGSVKEDISRTKVLSSNSDESDLVSLERKKADPVPYMEIFKLYADCCPALKQMQIRSNKRDQSAKRIWGMARKYGRNKMREDASKDETQWAWHYLKVLFETANETGFLVGKNNRGWKADFEFVTREDKAVKILEEGYQS